MYQFSKTFLNFYVYYKLRKLLYNHPFKAPEFEKLRGVKTIRNEIEFIIDFKDMIPPDPSGKLRMIISKVYSEDMESR